jgi:hypothetical protein
MIGDVAGSYNDADFGGFTQNNLCKENGCTSGQIPGVTTRRDSHGMVAVDTMNG